MGIIDQAASAPAGAAPAGAQPDQEAYQRVVIAGGKVLYQPEILKKILALIKSAPNPAAGLAQATALIIKQLVQASKGTMPQSVQIPAAKEIMKMIAEMAQQAGIIQDANAALQQAQQIIAKSVMKSNKLNPSEIQPAAPHGFQPVGA